MMDDSDGDGQVTFSELVEQLHRILTEDQRTMTCLTRFHVTEIQREMREELKKTQEILTLLHANVEENIAPTKAAERQVAPLGEGRGLQPKPPYPEAHYREE